MADMLYLAFWEPANGKGHAKIASGTSEKIQIYPRAKPYDTSKSHFDALPSIYISQIAFKKSAILWD